MSADKQRVLGLSDALHGAEKYAENTLVNVAPITVVGHIVFVGEPDKPAEPAGFGPIARHYANATPELFTMRR